MANYDAETFTVDNISEGTHNVPSYNAETFNPAISILIYYALRAYRTSDTSWQYWVSINNNLTDAPGGSGNYDASTLTSEGKY